MKNTQDNKTNKKIIGNHKINLLIGIIGMLIASSGNLLTEAILRKECFLIGAILLLISSLLERQLFFILLQIIIVVGTAIAFTSLSPLYKTLVPIVLSIIAIIYFISQGLLKDWLTFIGCLGIAFLAAGYAITEPVIYLLGAVTLMIYSFGSYRRGVTIALLWAILNAVFALTAIIAVYHAWS